VSVGGSSPSPLGGICIVTSRVTHALGLSGGRALFRSAMLIGRTWEASELGRDIEQPRKTSSPQLNSQPPHNSRVSEQRGRTCLIALFAT
jgi:hypothetical protein